MTKIAVDKALIEQALEALEIGDNFRPGLARVALRAALAEPAVEPFGYFRAEPFGWTDCAPTDEGAKALYEVPPPAEPARTSQDVCTVPLLSDEEINESFKKLTGYNKPTKAGVAFARAIEQAVRRKAGL